MKININGITREMTAEEIKELERLAAEMPKPEPDPTEARLAALEAQNAMLIEQLEAAKILLGVE